MPQSRQKPRSTASELLNTPGSPRVQARSLRRHAGERCEVVAERLLAHAAMADAAMGRLGHQRVAHRAALAAAGHDWICCVGHGFPLSSSMS